MVWVGGKAIQGDSEGTLVVVLREVSLKYLDRNMLPGNSVGPTA